MTQVREGLLVAALMGVAILGIWLTAYGLIEMFIERYPERWWALLWNLCIAAAIVYVLRSG